MPGPSSSTVIERAPSPTVTSTGRQAAVQRRVVEQVVEREPDPVLPAVDAASAARRRAGTARRGGGAAAASTAVSAISARSTRVRFGSASASPRASCWSPSSSATMRACSSRHRVEDLGALAAGRSGLRRSVSRSIPSAASGVRNSWPASAVNRRVVRAALQALEHPVQGRRELGDLLLAADVGQARRHRAGSPPLPCRSRCSGRRTRPDDQPGGERGDQARGDGDERDQAPVVVQPLLDRREALQDLERAVADDARRLDQRAPVLAVDRHRREARRPEPAPARRALAALGDDRSPAE